MGLTATVPARALRRGRLEELPEAGDLLSVEAIDRTGLLVTGEGAFVRVLRVTPANPLILSAADRDAIAGGFGRLLGRLRPGQAVQFTSTRARSTWTPCWPSCAPTCRPPPGPPRHAPGRRATRRRSRAGGCTRRSSSRCACTAQAQAAVALGAHVVIPLRPRVRGARGLLRAGAPGRLERSVERASAGGAREPGARRRAARRAGGARRCPCASSTAARCSGCCGSARTRRSPTPAARPPPTRSRCSASSTPPRDREQARQAALDAARRGWRSRASICKRGRHLLELGRDVEQVIYVHTTAQQTSMGWLLGAMLTRAAVHAQRARPRARSPPRAPADPARLPAVVRDQPRRRATRPRPGL